MDTCSKPMQRRARRGRRPRRRRPARGARAAQAGRPSRRTRQAPHRRAVVRGPPRHRRHRDRDVGRRSLWTATWTGTSPSGGRHPGGLRVRPRTLAATLGVATETGMKLIADALDLQHRLPRIWRSSNRSRWSRTRPGTSPRPPTASPATPPPTSTNSSPQARLVQLEGDRDRRRPRDRQVPPRARGAEKPGSSPGTSRCATPPRASTPAPPGSTSPATPSTSPPSTTSSATTPPP